MTRNPIKDTSLPLLVGLDHLDNSLVPKASEVIEQFGKKGKTLFIEAGTLQEPSDPKYGPFDAAVMKATEKGMAVVRLDRPRITKRMGKLLNSKAYIDGSTGAEYSYLLYDVRERQWVRTIQKQAKAGDIVMMHQLHLVRVLRNLHHLDFNKNVLFVSKVKFVRQYAQPLSKSEVRELKAARAARRPINICKKR